LQVGADLVSYDDEGHMLPDIDAINDLIASLTP
jgi:hypothetical protein